MLSSSQHSDGASRSGWNEPCLLCLYLCTWTIWSSTTVNHGGRRRKLFKLHNMRHNEELEAMAVSLVTLQTVCYTHISIGKLLGPPLQVTSIHMMHENIAYSNPTMSCTSPNITAASTDCCGHFGSLHSADVSVKVDMANEPVYHMWCHILSALHLLHHLAPLVLVSTLFTSLLLSVCCLYRASATCSDSGL